MKGAAFAAGAALVLLSACEDGAPTPNRTHIKIANPHSDQLKALSPPMQRLGLMRAIRDNGKRCVRVENGAYQEEYRGLEMWVALCDDGRYWSIFIAPNADIQVRSCQEHSQLDLPQCRALASAAPDMEGNANAGAAANAT